MEAEFESQLSQTVTYILPIAVGHRTNPRNGEWTLFDDMSGLLEGWGQYVDGKKSGLWIETNWKRRLAYSVQYENDEIVSKEIAFELEPLLERVRLLKNKANANELKLYKRKASLEVWKKWHVEQRQK